MTVRETIAALIEEERQFPHREPEHLDKCEQFFNGLLHLLDDSSSLRELGREEETVVI